MESFAAATRRGALRALSQSALAFSLTGALASRANADATPAVPSHGALSNLARTLATLPRRRSFPTVPLILNDKRFWDHEAADALLAYGAPRQMWEATDLAGPWLVLMREAVN